jgi:uncharacterized protein YjiK
MKLVKKVLAITALFAISTAHATVSVNLNNYSVSATYGLDILNGIAGGISGLEASAVSYAFDRNSLFFVGDEGTGVIETSLTGQTLGYMNFDWTGTGSTNNDTEGLTYLGGGVLVVGEERLQDAYQFTYSNGGTATLADNYASISNSVVGNNGMEGISYDPRNGGSFVTVKQQSPLGIYAGELTFSNTGGTSNIPATSIFDPSLLGLSSFSDVQTLGAIGSDDLLILSLGSRKLVTSDRLGNLLSSFDLSNVLPNNAIEGVTIGTDGTIYLVAEQIQNSFALGGDKSQLIVLTAAIPEADTYAMMLTGLGIIGLFRRRKKA